MHNAVHNCLNINEDSLAFLETVEQQMQIVADISRADILMYGRQSGNEAVVISHAQPYSIARVYSKNRAGRIIDAKKRPEVLHALISGTQTNEVNSFIAEGAPVVRTAFPIYYPPPLGGQWSAKKATIVASLCVVINLLEYERHRLRSSVFRKIVNQLQLMLLRARLIGAEELTPFGEHDGLIFADNEGVIRYASGIAGNLYRRIGYKERLVGRHLSELETADEDLRQTIVMQQACLELENDESRRVWMRKALPIMDYPNGYNRWFNRLNVANLPAEQLTGVLITLHDDTEVRRQDEEMRVKNAMIQEVHHRVKNNLQTIAGLVRMKSRRTQSAEAKAVLDETLHRILSVAVIHEFLSGDSTNVINMRDVSKRIMGQFQEGMLSPEQHIRMEVVGDCVFLPARQATACSLIINELLQNALEHGFVNQSQGVVQVNLQDGGNDVIITVSDDGNGLPSDFDLSQTNSLGFQIVKILAEGDLRGSIELGNGNENSALTGLSIKIQFPKIIFEGEKGWKEHASL